LQIDNELLTSNFQAIEVDRVDGRLLSPLRPRF